MAPLQTDITNLSVHYKESIIFFLLRTAHTRQKEDLSGFETPHTIYR